MRVAVDREVCTGHGRCYMLAPDVFEPDDRGHCEIVLEDVPDGQLAQAKLAVANCPEHALTLSD
jgi:ferredoxin